MGRPKEFDSEIVLNAAMDCFWTDGVTGTSISSLVNGMKIQRSSFYNSFGSRDGILQQVLERYIDQSPLSKLMHSGEEIEKDAPDMMVIDLILDITHHVVHEGKGRGCLFFNGLSELNADNAQAYELYQDHYAQMADRLDTLVERIKSSTPNGEDAGPLSVQHLVCILMGLSHYSKLDSNEERLAWIGLDQLAGLSPHFARLLSAEGRWSRIASTEAATPLAVAL